MKKSSPTRRKWFNLGFILLLAGILIVLYLAPEETTSPLPVDDVHQEFHEIESKNEADKLCVQCHSQEGEFPLPEDHPDPYRCLFCHKR